jgi:pantoate--beta-alanine ligase
VRTIRNVITMQRQALTWRREGVRVALVPTMGFLHEGHLTLVRRARRAVGPEGQVVVSIYVNPTQFGPREDLNAYPRDLKRDLRLCRENGADLVFVPADATMYADAEKGGYSTYVTEDILGLKMEGASRPAHFRGVTTVVAKLFNLVQPDVAVFGAKDWQQGALVKRMVKDLNFPVRIILNATVRERDGLAMSSRNAYLSAEERGQANLLWKSIQMARREVRDAGGALPPGRLKKRIERFVAGHSLARLDYVEFFDAETLAATSKVAPGTHMALAVFFNRARLIDNGRL